MAGDDLRGPERRQVERHLIGCPTCRARLAGQRQALDVLATIAATPPDRPNAPSLWPALARQVREQRHPGTARTFAWHQGTGWSLPRTGLALVASALIGLGLYGVVYHLGDGPLTTAQGVPTRHPAVTKALVKADLPKAKIQEPDPEPKVVVPSAEDTEPKVGENSADTGGTR
jgi:hypothetical protein